MDINLEHEVGVLSCFSLLFHFCVVYVKGNKIYYFNIHVLMKFFALFSSNLRNGLFLFKYCKNQAEVLFNHISCFLLQSQFYWYFTTTEMCASTCKLVSLNVRGTGNFKKRRTIFTWCRKQKADFIFLQETHSKMDSETCWRNEWGSDIIMAHGTSNSRGVAILVKKDVDCTIHSKVLDPSGQ